MKPKFQFLSVHFLKVNDFFPELISIDVSLRKDEQNQQQVGYGCNFTVESVKYRCLNEFSLKMNWVAWMDQNK